MSLESLTCPSLTGDNVHSRVRGRRPMGPDLETVQLLEQLEEFTIRAGGGFLDCLGVLFLEFFPVLETEGGERTARVLGNRRGRARTPLLSGAVAYAVVGSNPLGSGS